MIMFFCHNVFEYAEDKEEILKEWAKQICELTGYENRLDIEEKEPVSIVAFPLVQE